MKINQNSAVCSSDITLVPYSAHHVPKYHHWMSSAQLRALTASEELTLEEEFANQESWRDDPEKLTFISVDSSVWRQRGKARESTSNQSNEPDDFRAQLDDPDHAMLGDVNMFFQVDEEDEGMVVGELNIMVADPSSRGRGLGKRVLLMFLWYVISQQADLMLEYRGSVGGGSSRLSRFMAKIDQENYVSVKLFEKVGFRRISTQPNYFGEVELQMDISLAEERISDFFRDEQLLLLRYKRQDDT